MNITLDVRDRAIQAYLKTLPRTPRRFAADEAAYDALFPLLPLDTVGVPGPGPDVDLAVREMIPTRPDKIELRGLKGKERKAAVAANDAALAAVEPDYQVALGYLYTRLLYDPKYGLKVDVRGCREWVSCLSGTFRTYRAANGKKVRRGRWGPRLADVMVVGKNPGLAEIDVRENFVGAASEPLTRAFRALGVSDEDVSDWYFTNVVKHPQVDITGGIPPNHIKNCAPLLQLELRLVLPKFILLFGREAAAAVLGGKPVVSEMIGRVVDVAIPLHRKDEPPEYHQARAMVVVHPAAVFHNPSQYNDLVTGISQFRMLVGGDRPSDVEPDLHHVCVYTEHHLARVVDDIIAATPETAVIAVDCEWHGESPDAKGAYLRTIQFSHKPKHAYCVVLRSQGGKEAFAPGPAAAVPHLRRLLKSTADRHVRVGGHFLTADYPWLKAVGIDVAAEYTVAASPERTRTEGGWDSYRMAHAYREEMLGGHKLETLAARHCGVPRYDVALQAWKKEYCLLHGFADKDLGGYGECPDAILHPYALYDADATIRLFHAYNGDWTGPAPRPGMLDKDTYGNAGRTAFWLSQLPVPAILEMESIGLQVDRVRGDELTKSFIAAHDKLLKAFREWIGWEPQYEDVVDKKTKQPVLAEDGTVLQKMTHGGFNPGSVMQCREVLFGVDLNGKVNKATGQCVRVSPDTVTPLDLTPIMSSGKKAVPWDRVCAQHKDGTKGMVWPRTDKESLGILANAAGKKVATTVRMLRDLRFLGQVLKGVLRRPWVDYHGDDAVAYDVDEERDVDGRPLIYDGGLMRWMDHTDRVRTHFGLVETGRWSSWGPNLQNISKQREGDYSDILGHWEFNPTTRTWEKKGRYLGVFGDPMYRHPIRSMIKARDGHVLVEADYKMAEMAMIGWLAQDPTMIEHVRRNTLGEDHPEYLDLHSLTAITAFGLDTPENRAIVEAKGRKWGATKKVLEALGRGHSRVAAKNVNFGVPYQRSAEAIARQCREQGADVTVADAQRLINAYKETNYPAIARYLDRCMDRVKTPGWMAGTFLRYRRFDPASDPEVIAALERQACNFPIQNGVADAIAIACHELYEYRREHGGGPGSDRWFDFSLQVHDALVFQVPIAAVEWFVDEVLEECMSRRVDIWPRDLDGVKLPGIVEPYHLAIDCEVARYWGEELDRDWALSAGLPEVTAGGIRLVPKPSDLPPKPAPAD